MNAPSISELKKDLTKKPADDLINYCIRLAKFKKENKDLLAYLLYEMGDEELYKASVKQDIDDMLDEIETGRNVYFIKKGLRKVLRRVNIKIRFTEIMQSKIDIQLYFYLQAGRRFPPSGKVLPLHNFYILGIKRIRAAVAKLEEDLQADYRAGIDELESLLNN